MKLDSELEDASSGVLIPDSIQNGRVYEIDDKDPNDPTKIRTSEAGAPMAVLNWEIYEGEFTGRKIRYNTLMLGGQTKAGKPMPLGNYCAFLQYTGVPWTCLRCNHRHTDVGGFTIADKVLKSEHPDLKIGSYYCSKCLNPDPRINADTDDFMGARCGLSIGSEKKEGTDQIFNKIKGYTKLRD